MHGIKYFSLIIFFILFYTLICFADKSDYLVGLKAYDDGFYDVAKISLEEFLTTAENNSEKTYAQYLLYLIYKREKNEEKTKYYFNLIKDVKDKRFDMRALKQDKIKMLLKEDCNKAAEMVLNKPDKIFLSMYAVSNCPITDNISSFYYNIKGINTAVKLKVISKIKNKPETVAKIFNTVNLKKLKKGQLEYFGEYFFLNRNFDMFWKVYQNSKTDKMVNLALNRLWEIKDYKNFIRSYEYNKNSYKILPSNTCRAVQAYNTLKKTYDCNLIDSCFTSNKNKDFYVSKLGCYIEKKDKEQIIKFVSSIDKNDIKYICEYTEYLVANNFYNEKILPLFSNCKQSSNVADILIDKNKPDEVIKLFINLNNDTANYYICMANIMKKDLITAEKYFKKIKNKKLKQELNEYFN